MNDTETPAIRVLLVDDHDLFRTGLRNLLEEQGVDIVAEASSGSEALQHVRDSAPDVVVMDLNMPGMSGVEATRHISRDAPLTRVVVLTISDQEQDVMDAILAGACGYLLKDASIQELMQGLEAAAVGESLISPHIAGKVLQHVRATTAAPEAAATIRTELSDREIQVLKLIANGKDNAMIAGELHISPKTVKNHISNILMKLQIENRIQAAVYAVRSGIVELQRDGASSPGRAGWREPRTQGASIFRNIDATEDAGSSHPACPVIQCFVALEAPELERAAKPAWRGLPRAPDPPRRGSARAS